MKINDDDYPVEEIEDGCFSFTSFTERYGKAYFSIGVERVEDGVISAVYFIPSQQPDADKIYKYVPKREHVSFSVETWSHKQGIDDVKHRKTCYCPYHDIVEEDWCMPKQADYIEVDEYGPKLIIGVRKNRGGLDAGQVKISKHGEDFEKVYEVENE